MTAEELEQRKELLKKQGDDLAKQDETVKEAGLMDSEPQKEETPKKGWDKVAEEGTTDTQAVTKYDSNYLKSISNLGLEDLEETDLPLPTITLIQPNSTIVDANDTPLPRGQFYFKGTKEVSKEVNCIFLSFTKRDLPDFSHKDVMVHTWIFLGVMGKDLRPFLYYCKNTALGPAKEFLVNVKSMMLPMFAVKVQLTSEKIEGDKGTYYRVKFNTTGDIEDPKQLMMLESLTRRYGPKLRQGIVEEKEEPVLEGVAEEVREPLNEEIKDDLPF